MPERFVCKHACCRHFFEEVTMRKIAIIFMLMFFVPMAVYARPHGPPPGHGGHYRGPGYGRDFRHGGPPRDHYRPRYHNRHYYNDRYYHDRWYRDRHRNDWIAPVAIVGGILGLAAISQMNSAPRYQTAPRPPQRMCRDSYNYYDERGNFQYTRYVDRPCQ